MLFWMRTNILATSHISSSVKIDKDGRVSKESEQFLGETFYRREHTKPLFKKEHLLTVHNLYVYHCLMEFFKIMKNKTPGSTFSCLTISKRKPTLLLTPDPSQFFCYKATKLWNTLKKEIVGDVDTLSCVLTSTAKNNLKKFIFSKQCEHDANLWIHLNYTHLT